LSTPVSESTASIESLGERRLVALIRERFPPRPDLLQVGIGDDAAVGIPVRNEMEVLTTDALVEGVHFDFGFGSFFDVGYKALAVNVSDVAAMGGTPRLALLSLILPAGLLVSDLEALLDGFAEMAREADVALAGGNITRSPGPLVVDVALTGSVRPRRVLTRSGGRPGDGLYVSGTVGAAAAGLQCLRERRAAAGGAGMDDCVRRYLRPEPRHRLGALLGRTRAASACMDLSDGLADAVTQLATASGTGAVIDASLLPIPESARRWFAGRDEDAVKSAVAGGDDYELLFAVPSRRRGRLRTAVQQSRGVRVTRIGELTPTPGISLVRQGGPEPLPDGFTHF
jgi:thiamine-monophosphate kinase